MTPVGRDRSFFLGLKQFLLQKRSADGGFHSLGFGTPGRERSVACGLGMAEKCQTACHEPEFGEPSHDAAMFFLGKRLDQSVG